MNPMHEPEAPVDFEHLMTMTDGDREFAGELIEMYRIDTRQRLETLLQAIGAGDWTRVEREAHTIKGASSNMGTGRVRLLAYELEKLGRGGATPEGAQALLGQLAREYEQAEVALNAWLEQV
jgi:HPt (histidine-containing phosphotransfer) domain-containing protein